MKKVKFIYLLGGSIELIVKASVFKVGAVLIDEIYDDDQGRPFDVSGLSIQDTQYPFKSRYIDDLLRFKAIIEAKNNV